MAVQLLIYLLKQGYSLNEICILTAYRQQVSEIQTVSFVLWCYLLNKLELQAAMIYLGWSIIKNCFSLSTK